MEDGDVEEAVQWRLGENMTHSYFLDSVESWRPTFQMVIDIVLVILIMIFVMGALATLSTKNYLGNLHYTWQLANIQPNTI